MALPPVKPGGWAFEEGLTSAQMNELDSNIVTNSEAIDVVESDIVDIGVEIDAVEQSITDLEARPDVQVFLATGAGVWTKPSWAVANTPVVAHIVSGGGGGGAGQGGDASARGGGGGGGSGDYVRVEMTAADLDATEALDVGTSGGAGVTTNGGNGGDSTFDTTNGTITCKGGGKGFEPDTGGVGRDGGSGFNGGGGGGLGGGSLVSTDSKSGFGRSGYHGQLANGGNGGDGGRPFDALNLLFGPGATDDFNFGRIEPRTDYFGIESNGGSAGGGAGGVGGGAGAPGPMAYGVRVPTTTADDGVDEVVAGATGGDGGAGPGAGGGGGTCDAAGIRTAGGRGASGCIIVVTG